MTKERRANLKARLAAFDHRYDWSEPIEYTILPPTGYSMPPTCLLPKFPEWPLDEEGNLIDDDEEDEGDGEEMDSEDDSLLPGQVISPSWASVLWQGGSPPSPPPPPPTGPSMAA